MKLSVAFLYLGIGLVLAKKDEEKDREEHKIGDKTPTSIEETPTSIENTPLEKVLFRECSANDPCGVREGICDNDSGCAGSLICLKNYDDVLESRSATPGCLAQNYCMDPIEEMEEFKKGMAFEMSGTWVGEEKWQDVDGTIYDYCSRALFRGASDSRNYLSWTANYSGEEDETCEIWEVDPKSSDEKDWWYDRDAENLLLGDGYMSCVTEAKECSYDITKKGEEFEGFDVLAKSCGVLLLEDMLSSSYDCEKFQVTRVKGMVNKTETTLDVAILTYGTSYTGSFGNFTNTGACPNKPTFNEDELKDDENGKGTARFVLQVGAEGSVSDLSDWECKI